MLSQSIYHTAAVFDNSWRGPKIGDESQLSTGRQKKKNKVARLLLE
jgi:hypothetical protein